MRRPRKNSLDRRLRDLERTWLASGAHADLARFDLERTRAGRPFLPPVKWRPLIEVPRNWLAWLGPSHREREDVDSLAYHRVVWPDGQVAYATLIRGGDETYVGLEVAEHDDPDDDWVADWEGFVSAGGVFDGAVVRLQPAHGTSGQSGPLSDVVIRLVDAGERPVLRNSGDAPPALVIPRGERLYHGTLVEFTADELTTGGYDDVLWTTDNACIAQSYLACSGLSVSMGPGSMVWPSQDKHVQAVQARLGFDFGYGEPRGPVFDEQGRPSWHWPAGMPKERWEAEKEIKRRILEAGWKPIRSGSEVFEFEFDDGELLGPGECAEGRLFILTVEQDLRIFDMTMGGEVEGDLMDVDYHKLDVFRAAESRGFDGVKINDFAQSRLWGNFGHTSIGVFRSSLKKLSWIAIPARNFDWPDYETLQRGMTPELEAWLARRRNGRRR